ncbi:MAG: hypothetical protein AAF674_02455 [Pseudomonadota bacterium]
MKKRSLSAIAGIGFLASVGATPAQAACVYNDVYYDVGVTLCFGGWVQECTVAGYWKAVGMCNMTDPQEPRVRIDPKQQPILARLTGKDPILLPQTTKR